MTEKNVKVVDVIEEPQGPAAEEPTVASLEQRIMKFFNIDDQIPYGLTRPEDKLIFFIVYIIWDALDVIFASWVLSLSLFDYHDIHLHTSQTDFVNKYYNMIILYTVRMIIITVIMRALVLFMFLAWERRYGILAFKVAHFIRLHSSVFLYIWLVTGPCLLFPMYIMLSCLTRPESILDYGEILWNVKIFKRD